MATSVTQTAPAIAPQPPPSVHISSPPQQTSLNAHSASANTISASNASQAANQNPTTTSATAAAAPQPPHPESRLKALANSVFGLCLGTWASTAITIAGFVISTYALFFWWPTTKWSYLQTLKASCMTDRQNNITLSDVCKDTLSQPTTGPPLRRRGAVLEIDVHAFFLLANGPLHLSITIIMTVAIGIATLISFWSKIRGLFKPSISNVKRCPTSLDYQGGILKWESWEVTGATTDHEASLLVSLERSTQTRKAHDLAKVMRLRGVLGSLRDFFHSPREKIFAYLSTIEGNMMKDGIDELQTLSGLIPQITLIEAAVYEMEDRIVESLGLSAQINVFLAEQIAFPLGRSRQIWWDTCWHCGNHLGHGFLDSFLYGAPTHGLPGSNCFDKFALRALTCSTCRIQVPQKLLRSEFPGLEACETDIALMDHFRTVLLADREEILAGYRELKFVIRGVDDQLSLVPAKEFESNFPGLFDSNGKEQLPQHRNSQGANEIFYLRHQDDSGLLFSLLDICETHMEMRRRRTEQDSFSEDPFRPALELAGDDGPKQAFQDGNSFSSDVEPSPDKSEPTTYSPQRYTEKSISYGVSLGGLKWEREFRRRYNPDPPPYRRINVSPSKTAGLERDESEYDKATTVAGAKLSDTTWSERGPEMRRGTKLKELAATCNLM